MGSLTRIISYVTVLICFISGALALQSWLQRQTQTQLRAMDSADIVAKRQQLTQAFLIQGLTENASLAAFQQVATTVGVKLNPTGQAAQTPPSDSTALSFDLTLSPTLTVDATFSRSPAVKLISVYHRITLGLLLLGPVLFGFGLLIASAGRRPPKEDRTSRAPWATGKSTAVSFEEIAKFSNDRSRAFKEADEARRRIEQDLQVNRSMLDQSLHERIRLGRELHDNICQTLYAVCLTLESVQKKTALAPEMSTRVEQCMTELKRVNREVRAYLEELEPEKVYGESFEAALRALVESFQAHDGLQIETRIDSETIALIPTHQVAEIMNIVREAISNAVRHGAATQVTIRAGGDDRDVALSIKDNGRGFAKDYAAEKKGHGLGNMRARALALGGNLHAESRPGDGARILLTLPRPGAA